MISESLHKQEVEVEFIYAPFLSCTAHLPPMECMGQRVIGLSGVSCLQYVGVFYGTWLQFSACAIHYYFLNLFSGLMALAKLHSEKCKL